MNIVPIMFASPAYDEMVNLRLESIYYPIGLEIDTEAFAQEYKNVHLAVYSDSHELIGGVVALVSEELDEFMIKRKICLFKQIFIKKEYQRMGLGAQLLSTLEKMLIDKGYRELRLHVHLEIIEYYSGMGYCVHAKPFMANGIKQQVMKKKLQQKSNKLEQLVAVGNERA